MISVYSVLILSDWLWNQYTFNYNDIHECIIVIVFSSYLVYKQTICHHIPHMASSKLYVPVLQIFFYKFIEIVCLIKMNRLFIILKIVGCKTLVCFFLNFFTWLLSKCNITRKLSVCNSICYLAIYELLTSVSSSWPLTELLNYKKKFKFQMF